MATYKLARGMGIRIRCQVSGVSAQLAAPRQAPRGTGRQRRCWSWRLLGTRHRNEEENTYLLVPTGYWPLSLSRLESRSHSSNKGALSLKAQDMSRERLGTSDWSKNSAVFAKTFPNPHSPIRIPQSHLGLAWFLQFEKTTKIGSILKQG